MKYTNVKVPTITMDELSKLQNDYVFFEKMFNKIEKMKKKTPGNGFAKMKCKEHMDSLMMMFDAIDQGKVLIND
jgi:hypothetical protein|tara:strand:- start:40 stop:261 length:222 start_codon:yes stop_codon:yes gene_type:complete